MSSLGMAPTEFISIGANLSKLARTKPEAPALTVEDRTLSYGELHARTNRMARGLAARGVKLGDFVTIALPNGAEFVEAMFACWKLGATPQPVSWRLPPHEIRAIIALADSPIVISDSLALDAGRPVVPPAALLAASEDAGDLPDAIAPHWKAPTSGGSTGRPKLIVAGTPGIVATNGGDTATWRIGPGDTVLMPGPLYHNAPFGLTASAIHAGAHVVLMPKFDAEQTLKLVERHKVTWLYLVPTMMSRIWRVPGRETHDMSTLHTIWHMAAPCPPWLKEEWIGWIGGEKILELYGGTEAQTITVIDGTEWMAHKGSVGKPLALGEMKAFDASGKMLGPNETGEIFLRRDPSLPPSYHYVGAEARTLPGGWESLGDIGWFDEDGYLYLADRRTDMILVGGANVYPAEVEAAIDEHPLVQSSCVIGIPDDDLGARVHAIVQPRGGLSETDLEAHLAGRLVRYKRPRSIEFVTTPLRDDAGKVRRSQLRAERLEKK
jgi:bile acid-coenzyme A ligase